MPTATHPSATSSEQVRDEALLHILKAMASPERLTLYFDEQGICRYASAALHTRLNLSRTQVIGQSFEALHHAPAALFASHHDVPPFAHLLHGHVDADLQASSIHHPDITFIPLRAPYAGVIAHYSPHPHSPEWESLLNHFPTGTVLVGYDGTIYFANNEARQITRKQGPWTHIRECTPFVLKTPRGEQLATCDHPMKRAIASGNDLLDETLLMYFEDQEIKRVECSVFHVPLSRHPDAEKVLLFLFRDVSARHQRAMEKGDLLSIASHELRNPLTPLRGLLHMIKQDYQQSGHIETDLLHKAQNQVERLVKLVDGLLDVSIVETGKFSYSKKSHDLRELVDELIAGWCIRHGDERFELELPIQPLTLNIDAAGIEQVLHNLLDNAIKHSPEERPIRVSLHKQKDEAILRVEDRGKGFAMENSKKLFNRFTQGQNMTPRHGSLGLGLYVCKRIVEEHGGTICIDSAVNQGTTVAVSLPLR